jgi:very-short-patch-repair endonuclease
MKVTKRYKNQDISVDVLVDNPKSERDIAISGALIPALELEGGTIDTQVDENGVTWFKAKDVCGSLGYDINDVNKHLAKHVSKADQTKRIDRSSGQGRNVNFINESGVIDLVVHTSKSIENRKDFLESLGIKADHVKFQKKQRFEFQCFHSMVSVMFDGYEIVPQYSVDNYRIDFYIPELNLAVEIDEVAHERQIEEDRVRQSYIEKKLGCKFLRIKENRLKEVLANK